MADNILGTTSSSGLGANRKSRMASYNPNVTGLNTGGRLSKVSLGTGMVSAGAAGNIRTTNLRAGKVLPFVEQTPDAHGPLVTQETAIRGMTELAGAVEKYTDDINTLRSTEANLKLEEKFRLMFHGDENGEGGFLENKGLSAPESFQGFSSALDEEMKNALESLNPAAAQKSVMAMFAMRSSYMKNASEYSVQQKEKAKDDMITMERSSIEQSLRLAPHEAISTYVDDGVGGVTQVNSRLKEQWFSTFDAGELDQAESTWQQALLNTAEGIYQQGQGRLQKDGSYKIGDGLEEVKLFMDTVGTGELDPANYNRLQGSLISWENQEIKKHLDNEKLQEANAKKLNIRRGNTSWVNAVADLANPDKSDLTIEDARLKFNSGEWSKEHFTTFDNELQSRAKISDDGIEDYDKLFALDREITALAGSNAVSLDSGFIGAKISNSGLTRAMKDKLYTRLTRTSDKKRTADRSNAEKQIDFLIPTTYRPFEDGERGMAPNLFGRVATNLEQQLELEAVEYYDELIWGKELTHSEALEKVTKRYETGNEHFIKLPTIEGYGKPKRLDDLNTIKNIVNNAYKSGEIGKDKFVDYAVVIKQYMDYMGKHATEFDKRPVNGGF